MHQVWRLLSRLVAVVRHRRDDRELDQEMDTHRALLVDDYLRRGLSEDEARRTAHVTLGNATQLREAHREVRGVPVLEELILDLRYPLRGFRRQPGHADVLWMVVGQGLRVTGIGIVCGLVGAYVSTRLLESLLFDVSRTDAVTFVIVPALFVAVTVLASLIPAMRAARIDPVGALRV